MRPTPEGIASPCPARTPAPKRIKKGRNQSTTYRAEYVGQFARKSQFQPSSSTALSVLARDLQWALKCMHVELTCIDQWKHTELQSQSRFGNSLGRFPHTASFIVIFSIYIYGVLRSFNNISFILSRPLSKSGRKTGATGENHLTVPETELCAPAETRTRSLETHWRYIIVDVEKSERRATF